MGMTEKQGGSDVRANTTVARPVHEEVAAARYAARPQMVFLGPHVRRPSGGGSHGHGKR
jgi:hypothetical protein